MSFPPLTRRRATRLFAEAGDDTGAATAEYAIATMATVAEIERVSDRPATVSGEQPERTHQCSM